MYIYILYIYIYICIFFGVATFTRISLPVCRMEERKGEPGSHSVATTNWEGRTAKGGTDGRQASGRSERKKKGKGEGGGEDRERRKRRSKL